MPSLKKMRDIRKQQRLAAGKESPLNPRPLKSVKGGKKPLSTMDKGKQKRALARSKGGKVTPLKPTGIRKAAIETQKTTAARKPPKSVVKKPAAKKPAAKKLPSNVRIPGAAIAVGSSIIRAIPYIGAAVGAAAFGVKALSEGFSRVTRGWKTQTEISLGMIFI